MAPNLEYSFTKFNFGKCFLYQPGMVTASKVLTISNNGELETKYDQCLIWDRSFRLGSDSERLWTPCWCLCAVCSVSRRTRPVWRFASSPVSWAPAPWWRFPWPSTHVKFVCTARGSTSPPTAISRNRWTWKERVWSWRSVRPSQTAESAWNNKCYL